MRIIWKILALTIVLSPSTSFCFTYPECYKASDGTFSFPMPILVQDKDLRTSSAGATLAVAIDEKQYSFSGVGLGPIYAAAYYSGCKALVVVEDNGRISMFKQRGYYFELTDMRSPRIEVRTHSAKFSRVPGLLYLTFIDIVQESSRIKRQGQPIKYFRNDFTVEGRKFEGISLSNNNDKVSILEGFYVEWKNSINLYLPGNKIIYLDFPRKIGNPVRSYTYDPHGQSVFYIEGQGVVSTTIDGWVLHSDEGEHVADFSARNVSGYWYGWPYVKDGNFFVKASMGPDQTVYKLDLETESIVIAE